MNDFDLARADFQKVLQLYPSNKAAKAQLVVCQQRIRKQLEKEKKLYANMFERLAEEETKVRMGRVDGRRWHHLVPCQSVCVPVCVCVPAQALRVGSWMFWCASCPVVSVPVSKTQV